MYWLLLITSVVTSVLQAQEIRITEVASIESRYLAIWGQRYADNRSYVELTTQRVRNGLTALSREDLCVLREAADRATVNKALSLNEFMGMVRLFRHSVDQVRRSIAAIPVLPSMISRSHVHGSTVRVDSDFEVDFLPVMSGFTKELDRLVAEAQRLCFLVQLPNGQTHHQTGLNFDAMRQMNLYSADQVINMREEAVALRVVRTKDKRFFDHTYNQFVLNKILNFVQVFGESQRRRQAGVSKNIELAVVDLQEAFWTRSYIRTYFGMKIGSFGIDYTKRGMHLDLFVDKGLRFVATVIRNDNDLIRVRDAIYAALTAQSDQGLKTLKLWAPLYTAADAVMNVQGFFRGDRPLRKANRMVLKLILADIEEELALGKAGGLKDLRAAYPTRYYLNAEAKSYFKGLERRYVPDDEVHESDPEADIGEVNANSLAGVFRVALAILENQEDRIQQANGILQTIEELTATSKLKSNRRQRRRFAE